MASSIGKLSLMVSADAGGLAAGLKDAGSRVKDFAKSSTSHLAGISKGGGLGGVLGGLSGGGILGLAAALPGIGMAVGVIKELVAAPLEAAAAAEQAKIRFTALTGSVEDATHVMAQMRELGRLGFDKEDISAATRELALAGFETKDLTALTRQLAAVSGDTGTPVAELANVLSRVKNMGSLTSRELRQLGGPVLRALADTMHVPQSALHDMAAEGKIDLAALSKALNSLTEDGGAFADGLKHRAESMTGTWESMKNGMAEVTVALGQTLAGGLGLGGGSGAGGAVDSIKSGLADVQPLVKEFGAHLRNVWVFHRQIWEELGRPAFEAVKNVLGQVTDWLGIAGAGFGGFADTAWTAAKWVGKGLALTIDYQKMFAGAVLEYLVAPLLDFSAWVMRVVSVLAEWLGPKLLPTFLGLVDAFKDVALSATVAFKAVAEVGLAAFGLIVQPLKELLVRPIGDALKAVLDIFGDLLNGLINKMPDKIVPQWAKDLRDNLGGFKNQIDNVANFNIPLPNKADIDNFFGGMNVGIDALAGNLRGALQKALGEGGLARMFDEADAQTRKAADAVRKLGKEWKEGFGDLANWVDDFMERVRGKAKDGGGGGLLDQLKAGVADLGVWGAGVKLPDIDLKVDPEWRHSGAMEEGSKEAYSAILKYQTSGQTPTWQKTMTDGLANLVGQAKKQQEAQQELINLGRVLKDKLVTFQIARF